MKKISVAVLACTVALGSGLLCGGLTMAAPTPPAALQGGMPGMPPDFRRQRPSPEQLIEMTSQRTGYPKETLAALVEEGISPRDLGMICRYAKWSGRSIAEIAELRTTMTAGRIEHALGLTTGRKAELVLAEQADELLESNVVSRELATELLQKGYTAGEIKMAQALSLRSKLSLQDILAKKTAAKKWPELAAELGVAQTDCERLQQKLHIGPARKHGPGFSNIHFKQIDRRLITRVLHDNYLFSEEEIGACYDAGMSFGEIDLTCLYAYLAQKPLSEVLRLRDSYTEEQIKLQLGLTPQLYREKVIAYHARRLQDRFGLDAKVTIDYMSRGYAMHHVVSAYLIAPLAEMTFDEVINSKVPSQRWLDLAPELGLSDEEFTSVTDRISWEFRTKYEQEM